MNGLEQAVQDAGVRPDAGALLRLRDVAEAVVKSDAAAGREFAARASAGIAEDWLRAAILTQLGDHAGARAVLEAMTAPDWGDPRALWLLTRARLAIEEELPQAAALLRHAVQAAKSYRMLRQADTLWRQHHKRSGSGSMRPLKIAFAGSVTTDFQFSALRPMLYASGFAPELWNAPFGQHRQALLARDEGLAEFTPDLFVLCTDWRDAGIVTQPAAHVEELAGLWRKCRDQYGAAVLQWNYEVPWVDPMGRLGALTPGSVSYGLRAVNAALWEAEREGRGASILDIDGIASIFGKAQWEDPSAWEISRQYPSSAALPLLAKHTVAAIRAMRGSSSKCLVLDLDNTLWGGVIGEDGVGGIQLGGSGAGAAYRRFQEYIGGLRQRGVLLAVCSKNNFADAVLPFREHPEMVLRESDIAVFRANWESKEDNLQAIAKALNIGIDSLVFVDDNPAERARVRQFLPSVEVIEMPADPIGYARAVQEALCFEVLRVTEEDMLRTESLRANADRDALQASSDSPEAFLQSLAMRAQVEPFQPVNLSRIVQLINKTNQFNLTTLRTSEPEVRGWMGDPDFFGLTLRLADRFSDFGLTAILHGRMKDGVMSIENWLMSCRILGRGAEQLMLAAVVRRSLESGAVAIEAAYVPTAKNEMVADIYPKFGFAAVAHDDDGRTHFRLNLVGINVAGTNLEMPAWIATEGV